MSRKQKQWNAANAQRTPATPKLPTLSPESSRALAQKARAAAFALADFWDELRAVECSYNVSFDGTTEYIGMLAADCDAPPSPSDLEELTGQEVIEGLTLEKVQPTSQEKTT